MNRLLGSLSASLGVALGGQSLEPELELEVGVKFGCCRCSNGLGRPLTLSTRLTRDFTLFEISRRCAGLSRIFGRVPGLPRR